MPHCITEYSKPLKDSIAIEKLIGAVLNAALASGLFQERDIKCRAICYQDYCVGKEKKNFIHTTIYLLKGRTKQEQKSLSESVLREIHKLELIQCSITVDIRELDPVVYSK